MSVKQWKRIITLAVILTIILLLSLTIVFIKKSSYYNDLIEEGQLLDLSKYGEMDEKELSGVFKYLASEDPENSQAYHTMFPDLYVENDFNFNTPSQKTCYLTFDDGPDPVITSQILDILKEHNIKATFFVVYDDSPEGIALYKRIVNEGHTIGIHTASHDYETIYSSVEVFLENFEQVATHIEEVTGVKPTIYRFPAGSINVYNKSIYRDLITEVVRRGYVYYDWNVTSGDDSSYLNANDITQSVLTASEDKEHIIVLLHDGPGHYSTVSALPQIIKGLKEQGFSFNSLNNTVTPYCFGY